MTNAAAVSRTLRTAGFAPLPSGTPIHRDGVHIRTGVKSLGSVIVTIDTGLQTRDTRLCTDMTQALRDAGYTVEDSPTIYDGDDYMFARLVVTR